MSWGKGRRQTFPFREGSTTHSALRICVVEETENQRESSRPPLTIF